MDEIKEVLEEIKKYCSETLSIKNNNKKYNIFKNIYILKM